MNHAFIELCKPFQVFTKAPTNLRIVYYWLISAPVRSRWRVQVFASKLQHLSSYNTPIQFVTIGLWTRERDPRDLLYASLAVPEKNWNLTSLHRLQQWPQRAVSDISNRWISRFKAMCMKDLGKYLSKHHGLRFVCINRRRHPEELPCCMDHKSAHT